MAIKLAQGHKPKTQNPHKVCRSERFLICLTPAEKDGLARAAADLGLDMSDILRGGIPREYIKRPEVN